jgi:hypothetical protein
MGIAQEMKDTAVECARTPGRISIWSEQLGRYVCSEDQVFQQAMVEQSTITTVARDPYTLGFRAIIPNKGTGNQPRLRVRLQASILKKPIQLFIPFSIIFDPGDFLASVNEITSQELTDCGAARKNCDFGCSQ